MKMSPLEKAQAALRNYQKSRITFKCSVCGYVIRLAPPIPETMKHKNCTGQFQKVTA